jgi:hypothetical protein
VEESIRRIGQLSREHGVRAAFLLLPAFEDKSSFSDYAFRDLHLRLYRTAAHAELLPLDLLAAFRNLPPRELKINRDDYFDPWHLSEKGHRVTATLIEEVVFPRY